MVCHWRQLPRLRRPGGRQRPQTSSLAEVGAGPCLACSRGSSLCPSPRLRLGLGLRFRLCLRLSLCSRFRSCPGLRPGSCGCGRLLLRGKLRLSGRRRRGRGGGGVGGGEGGGLAGVAERAAGSAEARGVGEAAGASARVGAGNRSGIRCRCGHADAGAAIAAHAASNPSRAIQALFVRGLVIGRLRRNCSRPAAAGSGAGRLRERDRSSLAGYG